MLRFTRWGFIALVLELDVVTLAFDLLRPELRWTTATVLTGVLVAMLLARLLERQQPRDQERAARASLARANAARAGREP